MVEGRASPDRRSRQARPSDLMGAEERTDPGRHLDRAWLEEHLAEGRREAGKLGETREAIFGTQDGVASILIVVITVATATSNSYAVLVAGLAVCVGRMHSMSDRDYMV